MEENFSFNNVTASQFREVGYKFSADLVSRIAEGSYIRFTVGDWLESINSKSFNHIIDLARYAYHSGVADKKKNGELSDLIICLRMIIMLETGDLGVSFSEDGPPFDFERLLTVLMLEQHRRLKKFKFNGKLKLSGENELLFFSKDSKKEIKNDR